MNKKIAVTIEFMLAFVNIWAMIEINGPIWIKILSFFAAAICIILGILIINDK